MADVGGGEDAPDDRDPGRAADLTGEVVERRADALLRIAKLVAAGASNRDVAAQLFLSPKTVEYHLREVFLKLAVSSRVELARRPLEPARVGA
ncbi:MAG TPA: helix-turn-helix transcriptional regulator [Solirubrobacteraceae bacterium]|nr:helix-turn-helix transcriptional regulator [Solirubrobacteraceae bacterium]